MIIARIVLLLAAAGVNFVEPGLSTAGDERSNHVVRYQFQSPWAPPSQPAAGGTNRYAQPSGVSNQVSPPPGVLERTQTAVTETGSALRDAASISAEQGKQQLSRTGEQLREATRNVGQGFTEQLEDWSRSTGRQLESTSNNLRNTAEQTFSVPPAAKPAAGNGSPPPWPTTGSSQPMWPIASESASANPSRDSVRTVITPIAGGWTSLNSDSVAPPPAAPPFPSSPSSFPNPAIARGETAPSSSAAAGGQQIQLPSPLDFNSLASPRTNSGPRPSGTADPPVTGPSLLPQTNWQNSGTLPGTAATPSIGRYSDAIPPAGTMGNGWPAAQTPLPADQVHRRASSDGASRDGGDPFSQPAQGWPNTSRAPIVSPTPPPLIANQPLVTAPERTAPLKGAGNPDVSTKTPATSANQPPWIPLIVVSLSLIGSLSANLFLGWSYMDARQKYRALVRKTADKFRRAAEAA